MTKKQNRSIKDIDRIFLKDYFNLGPDRKYIYPTYEDRCDCCENHILELKPFGGPGDPLDEDYTGGNRDVPLLSG